MNMMKDLSYDFFLLLKKIGSTYRLELMQNRPDFSAHIFNGGGPARPTFFGPSVG